MNNSESSPIFDIIKNCVEKIEMQISEMDIEIDIETFLVDAGMLKSLEEKPEQELENEEENESSYREDSEDDY